MYSVIYNGLSQRVLIKKKKKVDLHTVLTAMHLQFNTKHNCLSGSNWLKKTQEQQEEMLGR